MLHETTLTKAEIMPNVFMTQIGTMPTFLKKNEDGSRNYVTDGKLEVGDEIIVWPFSKVVVSKVIESRAAKGNWDLPSYKGMKPTWNKITIL